VTGDLAPEFPLPGPGDRVLVLVQAGARTAPALVSGKATVEWCLVTRVRTRPEDLFPVQVRLPSGQLGAYQQGEIRGWQPAPRRRWPLSWLRRRW
jgi:hypothetical protein